MKVLGWKWQPAQLRPTKAGIPQIDTWQAPLLVSSPVHFQLPFYHIIISYYMAILSGSWILAGNNSLTTMEHSAPHIPHRSHTATHMQLA